MARLMASGRSNWDIADRASKRRTNQASHLVVTEGDRCGIQKGNGDRDGGGEGDNLAMAMAMVANG